MSTNCHVRNSGIRAACDPFRSGMTLDPSTASDEARIAALEIRFANFPKRLETMREGSEKQQKQQQFDVLKQELKSIKLDINGEVKSQVVEEVVDENKSEATVEIHMPKSASHCNAADFSLVDLRNPDRRNEDPIQQPNDLTEISRETGIHVLQQSQITGVLGSDSVKEFFTFDLLHTSADTGESEINFLYAELDVTQHPHVFANYILQLKVSMNVRLVLYKWKDGEYNGNHLSAGKMIFPKVYSLFLLVYDKTVFPKVYFLFLLVYFSKDVIGDVLCYIASFMKEITLPTVIEYLVVNKSLTGNWGKNRVL